MFITPLGRIGEDLWVNIRLKTIARLIQCQNKRVLDLGCGTGYTGLYYLEGNDVIFADLDPEAIERLDVPAEKKIIFDATTRWPLRENYFDYIFCADLLEHVVDDFGVMKNIHKALRAGGKAIITLPAFNRLYGHHDKLIGHNRRYDRDKFLAISKKAGFQVLSSRYACFLLFIPFLINQLVFKSNRFYQGRSRLEQRVLPLLEFISDMESKVNPPFGISLIFVLKKTGAR